MKTNRYKTIFYGHNFDLGMFRLYKDNYDGTAMFYQEIEIGEDLSYVKRENRLVKYKWDSMFHY